jgi:hypothetical protein
MHHGASMVEFLEWQEEIQISSHRTVRLDRGEQVLRQRIERRGTQIAERIGGIAVHRHMHLQFRRLQICEAHVALFQLDVADVSADELRTHPFIAKFNQRRRILGDRPTILVVERHILQVRARQKESTAVTKRVMPDRTVDDDLGVRQVPRDKRTTQPGERRRRDPSPLSTELANVSTGELPSDG